MFLLEQMAAILITAVTVAIGSDLAQENIKFTNLNINDVIFTGDVMFESSARSHLDCSTQCSNHLGCLTFTFTKGSPRGSCRGHVSPMTSGRPTAPSVESKTFTLVEKLAVFSECAAPPEIARATVGMTSRAVGTRLTYTCDINTVLENGPAEVTCQTDGTWTTPTFVCDLISECAAPPPDVARATVEMTSRSVGTRLTYTCDVTAVLVNGPAEVTCQTDGTWTTPTFSCDLISECAAPPEIARATVGMTSRAVGTRLTYTCDVMTILVNGPAEVTCQTDGTWTSPTFSCVQCSKPLTVAGTKVFLTSVSPEPKVTYMCSSTEVLIGGSAEVTCQSDGTWAPVPTFSCHACSAGPIQLTGNNGTLASPGYPGQYDDNLACHYVVELDQAGPQTVTMSISYQIEKKRNCPFDYLEVNNDGFKYCGRQENVPKSVSVAGNQWVADFSTDGSFQDYGFLITYHVV
ncbi:C4b-binding protein alpha chain-like [Littorina saxatilis]|uniref:C4b-binding protein alpha chain-like n=1 Tax=Littorina saxatilis TaxID=31220 RepID=UPI0038B5B91F